MDLPEGTHLAYIVNQEAWWIHAQPDKDAPQIIVECGDWAFTITERDLGPNVTDRFAIELKIFEDAFDAFAQVPDFFDLLREHKPTKIAQVRAMLVVLGAVDATPRVNPYTGHNHSRSFDLLDRYGRRWVWDNGGWLCELANGSALSMGTRHAVDSKYGPTETRVHISDATIEEVRALQERDLRVADNERKP